MNFTGTQFKGNVLVNKISRRKKELEVTCTLDGSTWDETWNLEHTMNGFEDGTYHIENAMPVVKAAIDMLDVLEEQLTEDAKENEDIAKAIKELTKAINGTGKL